MSRPAPTVDATATAITDRPPRWASRIVIVVVIGAFATGLLGTALSPTLVVDHPLLMIGLNANNRYLILVTNDVGAFGFYTVALLRRVVPTLAFYLLGWWYRERAVRWLEGREPASGEVVGIIEKLFDRFGWWVVAIAPMTFTCLLAGAARLRASRLVPLVIVSVAVRLVALRLLGAAFEGTLHDIVGWIDRSRVPLMIFTVGTVLVMAWSQRKRKSESFAELTALEEDPEA